MANSPEHVHDGPRRLPGIATTALDEVMALSTLPPLTGADADAERLVLLVHRGVNWDVWGGARRARYWDALADRVRAATYAGPTASDWFQRVCAEITSQPRSAEDRHEVARLLATVDHRAVRGSLHRNATALTLRVRVLSEVLRAARSEENP